MVKRYTQIICKSIFKNGEGVTKEQFTKKWIQTINILEKNKKTQNQKI